jgi:hypothetical protein
MAKTDHDEDREKEHPEKDEPKKKPRETVHAAEEIVEAHLEDVTEPSEAEVVEPVEGEPEKAVEAEAAEVIEASEEEVVQMDEAAETAKIEAEAAELLEAGTAEPHTAEKAAGPAEAGAAEAMHADEKKMEEPEIEAEAAEVLHAEEEKTEEAAEGAPKAHEEETVAYEAMKEESAEEPVEVEAEVEEAPSPARKSSRPRVTVLTTVLCVLNVLAALVFTYLVVMDYKTRQDWSRAVLLHDVALVGLPLEEESRGPSASQATIAKQNLDREVIKAAAQKRGVRVTDPYKDIYEIFGADIQPQDLGPDILNLAFRGLGHPVKTLEEEVNRVQKEVLSDIEQAADAFVASAKSADDKRKMLSYNLMSMAATGIQIDRLDRELRKIPPADLDNKLKDAVQRRLLISILRPLDAQSPLGNKDRTLDQAVEFYKVPLDQVVNLLQARFQSALAGKLDFESYQGNSIDKRRSMAYLLVVLSQVKKPDGTPLYSPERAQVVVGLYQLASATQDLTTAVLAEHQRLLLAIQEDRDGAGFRSKTGGGLTPGFVERYQDQVQRLRELAESIQRNQAQLTELEAQIQGQKKNYAERVQRAEQVTAQIVAARAATFKQLQELQDFRNQYFQARLRLREAHLQNLQLERQIRQAEGLKVQTP